MATLSDVSTNPQGALANGTKSVASLPNLVSDTL